MASKNKKRPTAAKRQSSGGRPPGRPTKQRKPPLIASVTKAQRRRRLMIQVGVAVVVLAVVAAIAINLAGDRQASADLAEQLADAGCTTDTRSDGDAGAGRNHREGVVYEVDPPAGGDHSPSPMPPGRYTPAEAPDDRLVHSLEHGYVVIWHRSDLSEEQLDAIDEVRREFTRDILVVERPSLDVPVAATAWHRRALCDTVDAGALAAFVDAYRNKGPERIPH